MLEAGTSNQKDLNKAEKWSGSTSGERGTSCYPEEQSAADVASGEQPSTQHSSKRGPGGEAVLHTPAESAVSSFCEAGRRY